MNRTLLLRLDGPLQSWSSPLVAETTIQFPTAPNLIGVILTALEPGRCKSDAELRIFEAAVRADEPGWHMSDFQTSKHCQEDSTTEVEDARIKVLRRGFVAGAVFTAAVGGTTEAVELAASALANPRRQPYLGRRCCPPAAPILLGLSDRCALEALGAVPYQGHRGQPPAYFKVAVYSPEPGPPDEDAADGLYVGPGEPPRWTRAYTSVSARPAKVIGQRCEPST